MTGPTESRSSDPGHIVGDPACPACNEGYPRWCIHTACTGLVHAGDEGTACDQCGAAEGIPTAIRPALTPDQWAAERTPERRGAFDRLFRSLPNAADAAFAVAAKALDELPHGDPRKPTGLGLHCLRTALEHASVQATDYEGESAVRIALEHLAVLEALLGPDDDEDELSDLPDSGSPGDDDPLD